jgi:hypothetical protein
MGRFVSSCALGLFEDDPVTLAEMFLRREIALFTLYKIGQCPAWALKEWSPGDSKTT